MRVLLLIGLAAFVVMTMLAPIPWMVTYIAVRLLAAIGVIALLAVVILGGKD